MGSIENGGSRFGVAELPAEGFSRLKPQFSRALNGVGERWDFFCLADFNDDRLVGCLGFERLAQRCEVGFRSINQADRGHEEEGGDR